MDTNFANLTECGIEIDFIKKPEINSLLSAPVARVVSSADVQGNDVQGNNADSEVASVEEDSE